MTISSNTKIEINAGLTSFLACFYIILVNPLILSNASMPYSAALTSTVLISAFSSIAMGLYAKNPIVIAPGMGLNAFFTYTIVNGLSIHYSVALGIVFWSGLFFLILSIFGIRVHLAQSIPSCLRYAISCGIGLFIALIGLKNGQIIKSDPLTMMAIAPINKINLCFYIGLFISALFIIKKRNWSLIAGILCVTFIYYLLPDHKINFNQSFISAPDFSLIGSLNLADSLKLSYLGVFVSMTFTDLFDSLSTFMAVSEAGNLKDERGRPKNIEKSLIIDSLSSLFSGVLGSSPGTSYIESAAGIQAGGRTGVTAIVAGLCFLPFLFLSPLLALIPSIATAPVLFLVGVFMLKPISKIQWGDIDEALPCFISLTFIPFTYSISQGISWGLISYLLMKIFKRQFQQINVGLIVASIISFIIIFYK